MMNSNLVSVIIPAYNQAQFLGKAIQSVLTQTYHEIEIIVVDDGSTDETPLVAKSFSDPRLVYIYQENRGLSGARNTGIQHSNGQYLTYLDSDDLFLPQKIEVLVQAMEANPDLGLVAGQAVPIDEYDNVIGDIFDTPLPNEPENLLLGNPLHVGSVLLRREWQEKAGKFDESLRSYEDWDMWLRLSLLNCPTSFVHRPVSLYRFHTAQMTRIGKQMTRATFSVLDKTFTRPDLPEEWLALKDIAYSNAHLRAMAQAYLAQDYPRAQEHLQEAVRLQPELTTNYSEGLAKRLAALADSPKNRDPVEFLSRIYSHLPDGFEDLRQRAPEELARAAVNFAFEAYKRNEYQTARKAVKQALEYQPEWLRNRGVVSVLLKSYTKPVFEFIFTS